MRGRRHRGAAVALAVLGRVVHRHQVGGQEGRRVLHLARVDAFHLARVHAFPPFTRALAGAIGARRTFPEIRPELSDPKFFGFLGGLGGFSARGLFFSGGGACVSPRPPRPPRPRPRPLLLLPAAARTECSETHRLLGGLDEAGGVLGGLHGLRHAAAALLARVRISLIFIGDAPVRRCGRMANGRCTAATQTGEQEGLRSGERVLVRGAERFGISRIKYALPETAADKGSRRGLRGPTYSGKFSVCF